MDTWDTRRIVIEFSLPTVEAMDHIAAVEDLNPSTIVNRAVQMYWLMKQEQMKGTAILFKDAHSDQIRRFRWE